MDGASRPASLPILATFGEALRYARRAARLTQSDLGIAVGYSREQINRLENGQRSPDLHVVGTLFVAALGLDRNPPLAELLIALAGATTRPASLDAPGAWSEQSDPLALFTHSVLALTRFIGRADEVREGLRLLEQTRLLVLVGAGGMGKTRLAYELAARVAAGGGRRVLITELMELSEPTRLGETIAATLGLLSASDRTAEQVLIDHLRPHHTLLVLDNCEHLLMACARLAETLLRACPNLQILATSREAFGTLSALTWRVPALSDDDAVQLFANRAQHARHDVVLSPHNLPIIAAICAQLDRMPLAIELAAARVRALSVEQIAERLSDRLNLLTSARTTAAPRQQTLRATIDWSYALLNHDERALLRALSVFSGGWTLDAAEAILAWRTPQQANMLACLDLLTSLVDKSLVVVEEREQETRYKLLETIRDYAHEKLRLAEEEPAARDAHLGWLVDLLQHGEPQLRTEQQRRWYARYEAERENIRAALGWAIKRQDKQQGVRLIASLWFYWFWRGHWAEGTQSARAVFALPGDADPLWYSRALVGVSSLPGRMGDFATFGEWLRQGQAISEALDDTATLAWARISGSYLEPDPAAAVAMNEEALRLARLAGDHWNAGNILYNLGDRFRGAGDMVRAELLYRESVLAFRSSGDQDIIAFPIGNLGRIAFARGDDAAAQAAFEESIAITSAANNRSAVADWHVQLARVALRRGDHAQAYTSVALCVQTFLDVWNMEALADTLVIAADLARLVDDAVRAATLLGAAEQIYREFHFRRDLVEGSHADYLQQCIDTVQASLGQAAFASAFAAGQLLGVRDAAALAVRLA